MSKSKMKLIVYILLFLWGGKIGFAQNLLTKKEYFDRGKKQLAKVYQVLERNPTVLEGKTVNFFINGKTKSEGNYKRNKPTGIWNFYYESGKIKTSSFFVDGKQEGSYQQYFENGKLAVDGYFVNGLKDSTWLFYSERGFLEAQHIYKLGEPKGTWLGYYANKKIRWERFFNNTKSLRIEYYENGILKSEGILKGEASDSVWKYYHENGQLKAKGEEKAGLRIGCWELFDLQGMKEAEGCYNNGLASGEWKYFFPNGALKNTGKFEDGKKEGEWRMYFSTGEIAGEGNFSKGNGEFKEFYPDGKLKTQGYYKDGKAEGEWLYFYEEGTLEGKAQFEKGKGEYKGFYRDGTIKTTGSILNGQKIGIWSLYDKEGGLIGTISSFSEEKTGLVPIAKKLDDSLKAQEKVYREASIAKIRRNKLYLKARNNENWFLGFGINPVGPFRGRMPLSLEYAIPERIGIEFTFSLIRSPFLGNFNNPTSNTTFERGYSLMIKHKFFQKDKGYGSFYFAPDIRYLNFEWFHNFQAITVPIQAPVLRKARWEAVEIAATLGWRSDKNLKNNNRLGVDIYVGPALGNKFLLYNPDDFSFSDMNQNRNYLALRFGVVLFYMVKNQ